MVLLAVAGCVTIPPAPTREANASLELKNNVDFLCRRQLGGRKPGTHGSHLAQELIETRFRAAGLIPWGPARGFEHGFGHPAFGYGGRNVVGFLPGSDPALSNDVIIVSAHYDHLGKGAKGQYYLGAADNASGVAALLEVARQLGSAQPRPKRSILFVAFDCEEMMLFGSFVFSCEPAVQRAKVVAVVNMDMLGRDFFDVVHHALFVAGAERYPELRREIGRFGNQAGIRILPLGSDLVGPRSDHVAFEPRGVPCLFFSCGTFSDYHKTTDTPDKLNYADLAGSAQIVRQTVQQLADGHALEPAGPPDSGYRAELGTVNTVMSEVIRDRGRAGIKDEDASAFEKLAQEAQELASRGTYDRRSREKLIVDASGILAPYFLPTDFSGKPQSAGARKESKLMLQYLYAFYLRYGPEMMEGYRQLVAQLIKYRPGPVHGMPRFNYQFYDLADEDISLAQQAHDRYVLNALANCWTMTAEVKSSKWLLKSFSCSMGSSLDAMDCEGTLQQLADFCLLRLRSEQTNAQQAMAIRKVLRTVAGPAGTGQYPQLLQARLRQGGFRDETEWIASCIREGSPDLAMQAIDAATRNSDPRICQALCQVLANPKQRSDVRAAAINWAGTVRDREILGALCELLNNSTPAYRREFFPLFDRNYPFSSQPVVGAARAVVERQFKASLGQTLGELAHAQLKNLAKRDLGKDPRRWRDWLQAHPLTSG